MWRLLRTLLKDGNEEPVIGLALALAAHGFGAIRRNALQFGYRHLEIELEGSDSAADVETELAVSGPIAGFAFRF